MVEFVEVKTCLHAEKVSSLAEIIWREYYTDIVDSGFIEYILSNYQSTDAVMALVKTGYSYYLLCLDGAEVGYFAIVPDEKGLFLSKLYLLDYARGHGLGKECMNYVCDKARRVGLANVHLTVNKNNLNSIAAYKKLGFVVYGEAKTDIGGGYAMDDFLMEKPI